MIWTLLPRNSGIWIMLQGRLSKKAVLDDATAMLPEAKRTSAIKAEIVSHILVCAAKGVQDPVALKMAALLAVVECSHYSHDISPERRAV
jgi:hypothetical protein